MEITQLMQNLKPNVRTVVKLYINSALTPNGSKGTTKIEGLATYEKDDDKKKKISIVISEYLSIKPEINNRLLINFLAPKNIMPGNVYEKNIPNWMRRKKLLKTYFGENSSLIDEHGHYKVSYEKLKTITFIELEVTPLCDCVQNKWLKSRLLPGVLIPEEFAKKKDIKKSPALYDLIPLIKLRGMCCKPVFDFRLLKSVDIENDESKLEKPLFRIRSGVFADILSRLSSHASRVGITCIE